MEVRIGISNSAREISFETDQKSEEVISTIEKAAKKGDRFVHFTDTKNSDWHITIDSINFIEFVPETSRRVGFVN